MPRDAAFWIAALHSDVCGRPSVIETALVRDMAKSVDVGVAIESLRKFASKAPTEPSNLALQQVPVRL
jgi:hypothetical protein